MKQGREWLRDSGRIQKAWEREGGRGRERERKREISIKATKVVLKLLNLSFFKAYIILCILVGAQQSARVSTFCPAAPATAAVAGRQAPPEPRFM